jgi:hypothetical protein
MRSALTLSRLRDFSTISWIPIGGICPGYSVISINIMLLGIHAREWISPATVTYILDQLVENAETHRSAQLRTFYLTYCSQTDF